MFSYCKRSSHLNKDLQPNYHVNNLLTLEGFNKGPFMCNGLNLPRVPFKQTPPGRLLAVESQLRGRNRSEQMFCQDEQELPQFSTFRPMPIPAKGPPPCAPSAMLQTSGLKNPDNLCRHVTLRTPCGNECACGQACLCKDVWMDMNKVPYKASPAPMCVGNDVNYRF